MGKHILSVGLDLPSADFEYIEYESNRSLLEGDIILFHPEIGEYYSREKYQGKPSLDDNDSFRLKEVAGHWRKEISVSLKAGKIVIYLLCEPEEVYVATGEKKTEGAGKHPITTRYVRLLTSYQSCPLDISLEKASGKKMQLDAKAHFFTDFWKCISLHCVYEGYFNSPSEIVPLLTTKSGERVVGGYKKVGNGHLLLVPQIDWHSEGFIETKNINGRDKDVWGKPAELFTKKLGSALVALASKLAAEGEERELPDWAKSEVYVLEKERKLREAHSKKLAQLKKIEADLQKIDNKMISAGKLRGLLFQQGKSLEVAVITAMQLMGFEASEYAANNSQFDVVLECDEGRLIGEVEGKDSKPINVEKFSQLERNINEDYEREDITEHAKGVLFGNAYRLTEPSKREAPFTEKCLSSAARTKTALVHTPDLFEPARYLSENKDKEYGKLCRQAILTAQGGIVKFPDPPVTSKT